MSARFRTGSFSLMAAALALACNTGPTAGPPDPTFDQDAATDASGDPDSADLARDTATADSDPAVDPDANEPVEDVPLDGIGDGTADESDGSIDAPVEDATADSDAEAVVCTPYTPQTGSPRIQVGTGLSQFEPLESCQVVPIILGPQGGAHVWGGFRASGFEATNLMLSIDFTLVQDGDVVASANYQDIVAEEGGEYEYSSVVVLLPEGTDPEDIEDRPATLTVHVHRDGLVDVADSIEIIPNCCEF